MGGVSYYLAMCGVVKSKLKLKTTFPLNKIGNLVLESYIRRS